MSFYRFLLALTMAIVLAGCAPVDSLNPLYTDHNVVFDPALLGRWQIEDGSLDFAKLGENGYRLAMSGTDNQTGQIVTVTFDAHLVSLDGHRFLDLVCRECGPVDDSERISEVQVVRAADVAKVEPRFVAIGWGTYLEFLPGESSGDRDRLGVRQLQVHKFFKVVMEDGGTTLKLIQLDDSWIDKQIENGTLAIDHELVEKSSAVLTASTPDLQQFVLDHVDDEEAFKGETVAKRTASESQQ